MLERILTSLEISRKLHALNVEQRSMFYWVRMPTADKDIDGYALAYIMDIFAEKKTFKAIHSSFAASELLTMLPHHLISHEEEPFNSYRLHVTGSVIVKNPECIDPIRTHVVNYECDTYKGDALILDRKYLAKNIWDENPADALAKMLIYLIENKFIELNNG